jgi:hypothetical protein
MSRRHAKIDLDAPAAANAWLLILTTSVLVLLSLPLDSEEAPPDQGGDLGDLRLSAGPAPAEAYQRLAVSLIPPGGTSSNASTTSQRQWGASGVRVAVQQVDPLSAHTPAQGWVVGYELALDRSRWQDRDDVVRTTSATLDLIVGYSWSLTRRLHLELTPLIGAGLSRATLSTATVEPSDRGVILEEALRLAIVRTAHSRSGGLQVGLETRIDSSQSHPLWTASDPVLGTITVHDRLLTLGWCVLGSIGYRY